MFLFRCVANYHNPRSTINNYVSQLDDSIFIHGNMICYGVQIDLVRVKVLDMCSCLINSCCNVEMLLKIIFHIDVLS